MPRPPDQPVVTEDAAENAARERTTLGELVQRARAEGWEPTEVPHEPIDVAQIVFELGPQRWAELRERRDAILAFLRARREDTDGG